ncbi:MAG: Ribosomal large subunit pseudouridine synthase B [Candidatus Anoxychlamydiales bacterium]|nr:Ribosomal large subunit pseudouridine synthase B [Candidatus Anoxychlamydiales bacterium]
MSLKRLNKFLSHAGIASRRKVEELILNNKVKVNNVITNDLSTKIDSSKDKVTINNKLIKEQQKLYFILNKPKGYLCSNQRKDDEKLVIDLFENFNERLFTVGRLDKDTTGLIMVTNDGDAANKIIHPSSNIEKEYLIKIKESIKDTDLKKISKGCFVENQFIKPKSVKKIRNGTLKIIITEGKKREIRIMIKKANLSLISLSRIRVGNLKLGSLEIGFFKQVKLNDLLKVF